MTLIETSLAESQTDSYFPTKWPNGYPKQKDISDTHIQRRTITKINHDRRTALEQSVKSISLGKGWGGGGGLNRFYVATILALTSAAVWTHNLFSPHEGFLLLCGLFYEAMCCMSYHVSFCSCVFEFF